MSGLRENGLRHSRRITHASGATSVRPFRSEKSIKRGLCAMLVSADGLRVMRCDPAATVASAFPPPTADKSLSDWRAARVSFCATKKCTETNLCRRRAIPAPHSGARHRVRVCVHRSLLEASSHHVRRRRRRAVPPRARVAGSRSECRDRRPPPAGRSRLARRPDAPRFGRARVVPRLRGLARAGAPPRSRSARRDGVRRAVSLPRQGPHGQDADADDRRQRGDHRDGAHRPAGQRRGRGHRGRDGDVRHDLRRARGHRGWGFRAAHGELPRAV